MWRLEHFRWYIYFKTFCKYIFGQLAKIVKCSASSIHFTSTWKLFSNMKHLNVSKILSIYFLCHLAKSPEATFGGEEGFHVILEGDWWNHLLKRIESFCSHFLDKSQILLLTKPTQLRTIKSSSFPIEKAFHNHSLLFFSSSLPKENQFQEWRVTACSRILFFLGSLMVPCGSHFLFFLKWRATNWFFSH